MSVLTICVGDTPPSDCRDISVGDLDRERLPVLAIRIGDRERLSKPDRMIIHGDRDREVSVLTVRVGDTLPSDCRGSTNMGDLDRE